MLVVGTSAQVYPAAALAMQNDRAFVAEINPDATALSDRCNCVIREGAAAALPRIVRLTQERALREKQNADEGGSAGDEEEHFGAHERGN